MLLKDERCVRRRIKSERERVRNREGGREKDKSPAF